MKKFYLLLLLLFVLGLFSGFSQTQITLTFIGKDSVTQNQISLTSVYVKNLTENCDTLLYGNTPVLSLIATWPFGVERNNANSSGAFILKQNYPNPFQGSTVVNLYREYGGLLNLILFDELGNKLAEYLNDLEKGFHSFAISSSGNKVLVLSVFDAKNNRSIKIISAGQGNENNTIQYLGHLTNGEKNDLKNQDNSGFIFYLGNQMMYTAKANGYKEKSLTDNPKTNSTYTFNMPMSVFTCGSTFTISHVAGAVAPVNKTVTYSTVTNIPGEPSKCWINSNLGADHQATAVSDATEASAGWYWQFNNKQGYKHDGTTRTPNTTWITSIDENLDWQSANDPCALELGNDWRIPTYTEWANVDGSGNWTNWNGPWNSDLKLHAAGLILSSFGSLSSRGSFGFYWGSEQTYITEGWAMIFDSNYSYVVDGNNKANGFPLRCLRDAGSSPTTPTVNTSVVSDIIQTTATSGGNITSDGGSPVIARGICYSTSSNPTITNSHTTDSSGTGTFVSNLIGLTANTLYYVRAYATNSVGTAYGNEVSFTTLAAGSCGSSITITHVAGAVAPVNKTVTYGTVTNIPGETSKCWITSNLGADHQATAVNDATEASAGWYWQFNRKQGYKHDGTTRTPTTWIYPKSDAFDWQTSNDPCALELGSGWRLPTSTEWNNVNTAGNWANWNGPWNSGLKIHAAGNLDNGFGSLEERGGIGTYWSSTVSFATEGWYLIFSDYYIFVKGTCYGGGYDGMAYGFTLRCLRDAGSYPTTPIVNTSVVSDITKTTATSGGNVTSDGGSPIMARGICYSTSSNPTIANSHTTDGSGTGAFVSNLTGLTENTLYYVKSYATNSIGTAYGNEVSFTTSTCGSSIIINHVAGSVAPVTKTVTYGTVTNIPGETLKCWITSNLGADHQATSVDDATEASAGWYWQFNRKQGYKHDGTTRTPNTTWIYPISEAFDWQTSNDPCALELGTGWHIPTYTEWSNVHTSGGWTDWDGPWNSGLKMHAAGILFNLGGWLSSRGSYGSYWSSTQHDADYGWYLYFYSTNNYMDYYDDKAFGFPLRCLRDN